MRVKNTWLFVFILWAANLEAQPLKSGMWKGWLQRTDGKNIVFNFDVSYRNRQPVIHIHNAEERLEVKQVSIKGDSVFIEMPFFESGFELKLDAAGSLNGNWVKGTTGKNVVLPFTAKHGNEPRFLPGEKPRFSVSGKWELEIIRPNGTARPAIAELVQKGSRLSGTILTPTGDYRYLEGLVKGDSLYLSTFNGAHVYFITAAIHNGNTLGGGVIYGSTSAEKFSGRRNDSASLSKDAFAIYVKPGAGPLDFRFPDLDGNLVDIKDERFRNKVVVVQLMGSWCPNCMDETNFLSAYYKKNFTRGLEIISLAYEYSTDVERSRKSLKKLQQRFAVTYPMLITGVTSTDSLRTEKTLPQLSTIKAFPSLIFIGKDGAVRKVHSGFYGPATGNLYTKFVQEFEETVNALVNE